MASKTMKLGPVATGTELRNCDLAEINSEHIRLEALRASYLSEVFGLSAGTALLVAELAFGEARNA